MDVRARVEPGATAARCPYCHDLLAVDAAQAECEGCGTRHHAACLEELGRCTVLGCAWSPPGRTPRLEDARSVEEVRVAVRARACAFVTEHSRPAPRSPARQAAP